MGKKARKTRWRTLPINSGEQSDSGESNTHSGPYAISKSYQQKPYFTKFHYSSSQSTPIKSKFQNDPKSTRSSSTSGDSKITFNEDEYTRITTPRQDVLFKKGYLSKPKSYQTQTSTGNSTISTGNSTGNGTPDHQSADGAEGTDLEYESQFVFPNHFVDQNGFYYINSFGEPYTPVLVYNPPFCYPEYPETRWKRYSTSSLTESTSPHNEEVSQDLSQSGSDTLQNSAETNTLVLNEVQPSYIYDNAPELLAETPAENDVPRKTKKRRRRRLSKPLPDASSSEEGESDEEPESTIPSSNLKPDAKVFVPRYNPEEHVQYVLPTNFIPMPLINEIPPNFYPPAIPVNFILPDSKVFTSFVNIIPNDVPSYEEQGTIKEVSVEEKEEKPGYSKNIDINRIVLKLEEAAKEQRLTENSANKTPAKRFNSTDTKTYKKKTFAHKKPEVTRTPNRSNDKTITNKSPILKSKRDEGFNTNKTENCSKVSESRNVPKSQNQWIPAVNRKKRRNRNVECETDFDEVIETEKTVQDDGFEAYDINLLVDVPTNKLRDDTNNALSSNNQNECEESSIESTDVDIKEEPKREAKDIQVNGKKETFVKIEYKTKRDVKIKEAPKPQSTLKENDDCVESTKINETTIASDTTFSSCEKIENTADEAESTEDISCKNEESSELSNSNDCESNIDLLIQTLTDLESATKTSNLNKKAPQKRIIITDHLLPKSSTNQSTNTKLNKSVAKLVAKTPSKPLNNQDSPEKKRVTKKKNKKTLQVSNSKPSDDKYNFLLNNTILEDERTNVEVSEELDKLIQRSLFKALEEKVDTSVNIDKFFSNISLDDKTEKQSDLSAILKSTTNLFSNQRRPSTIGLEISGVKADEDGLYPVTQAVKEWMKRVREATPEVEILKSPKTILKELGPKNSFTSRAGECSGDPASADNCSLSVDNSIESDDLVWDDDDINSTIKENGLEIAEEAEVLDVKNYDDDKRSTFPKHGELPYKAICCTLM